jgi:hypothetical protein
VVLAAAPWALDALARLLPAPFAVVGRVEIRDRLAAVAGQHPAATVVAAITCPGVADWPAVWAAVRQAAPRARIVWLVGADPDPTVGPTAARFGIYHLVPGDPVDPEALARALAEERDWTALAPWLGLTPAAPPPPGDPTASSLPADTAAPADPAAAAPATRPAAEPSPDGAPDAAPHPRPEAGSEPTPAPAGRGRWGRRSPRTAPAIRVGRRITVFGAHGGAGATTVAVRLAHWLDAHGLAVGLFEAAPLGGHLLRWWGRDPVEQGWESGAPPETVAVPVGRASRVCPRGCGPGSLAAAPEAAAAALAWLARTQDVTLIDAGTGWAGPAAAPLWDADALVLAVEPTPTGLAAALRWLGIAEAAGAAARLVGVVSGRRPGPRPAARVVADLLGVPVFGDPPPDPGLFARWAASGPPPAALAEALAPLAQALVTDGARRIVL